MVFRIDCGDAHDATIRVAGELGARGAAELAKLVRARHEAATIDLDQLVSVDAAAVAILRDLADQGARFVGASPYIRMLIEGELRNRIQR